MVGLLFFVLLQGAGTIQVVLLTEDLIEGLREIGQPVDIPQDVLEEGLPVYGIIDGCHRWEALKIEHNHVMTTLVPLQVMRLRSTIASDVGDIKTKAALLVYTAVHEGFGTFQ